MHDLMECRAVESATDETATRVRVERWQQNYVASRVLYVVRCVVVHQPTFSAPIVGQSYWDGCAKKSIVFSVHSVHTNIHDVLSWCVIT